MKKLLLFMLGALFALQARARDFTYTYQGQTLTYTVLDEDAKTCSTKASSDGWSAGNKVTGDLAIPAVAKDGDTEYTVTTIGKSSFNSCTDLTSVIIPNTVTAINESAFFMCSGLSSVTIPNSVTVIGEGCFPYCFKLESVILPENLTEIPGCAFQSCSKLTKVTIPESVKSIGNAAFSDCYALSSVTFGNSLTSIGDFAFSNSGLTSATIPESVTTIGEYSFQQTPLTSVNIPSSVSTIGRGAFMTCTSLTEINVNSENKYFSSVDGIVYTKDITEIISVPGGIINVNIPNTVTSIAEHAFEDCILLSSVKIPNSVTVIDNNAFNYCKKLTTIDIPNSVSTIGENAFRFSGLTKVSVPSSVNSIEIGAFTSCPDLTEIIVDPENQKFASSDGCLYTKSLKSLMQVPAGKSGHFVIPSSVLQIYIGAFESCKKITSVEIPNTVIEIGNNAFEDCSGLSAIEIPNSVERIYSFAFFQCSNLTSVKIPDSVTRIDGGAFQSCKNLISVTLGRNLVYLGRLVFINCSKITDIYSYAKVPPTNNVYESPFDNTTCMNAILHVPGDCVEDYKSARYWSTFVNIVGDASGIEDVVADSDVNALVEVYNLNGVKIGNSTEALAPGIYIVRQGTITKKIAVDCH